MVSSEGWGTYGAPGVFVTRGAAGVGCGLGISRRPPGSMFVAAWVVIQTQGRCLSRNRHCWLVHAQLWPLSPFSGRERCWDGVQH
jgi:hypothetical protein